MSVAAAIAAAGARARASSRPGSSRRENLSDLLLGNLPVLIVALGDDAGDPDRRDRHLGRLGVRDLRRRRGRRRARPGCRCRPSSLVAVPARRGARRVNGALVAYVGMPSIVVTLATMVALRDGCAGRRGRVGAGPAGDFQWLGLSQAQRTRWSRAASRSLLQLALAWGLRHLAAGRAVYATGSNPSAARLAGFDTAARDVRGVRGHRRADRPGRAAQRRALQPDSEQRRARPGDEGDRGGRRRRHGDSRRPRHASPARCSASSLLATIGPALTFLGVSAYWERAIQGAIILVGGRGRRAARAARGS